MSVLRRFDGAQWVQIAGPSNNARYLQGPIGDRPIADGSLIGTFYWATDEGMTYYSTGSAWEEVKGTGGEAFHIGDEPPEDPEIEMWYDTSLVTNLQAYGIESGAIPPEDTTYLWIDTEDNTGTTAFANVIYAGDNTVARPDAVTVYWKNWPDGVTPANALDGDLVSTAVA